MTKPLQLRRLEALLALETLSAGERAAFETLRYRILVDPAATFADRESVAIWRACTRHFAGELASQNLVDAGKPVTTPAVLRHLPLRPPARPRQPT